MTLSNPPSKIPMGIRISPLAFERMTKMCDHNTETKIGLIERAIHAEWQRFLDEKNNERRDFVDRLIAEKK